MAVMWWKALRDAWASEASRRGINVDSTSELGIAQHTFQYYDKIRCNEVWQCLQQRFLAIRLRANGYLPVDDYPWAVE